MPFAAVAGDDVDVVVAVAWAAYAHGVEVAHDVVPSWRVGSYEAGKGAVWMVDAVAFVGQEAFVGDDEGVVAYSDHHQHLRCHHCLAPSC